MPNPKFKPKTSPSLSTIFRSASKIVTGSQYNHMDIKNKGADFLMAAIERNEIDATKEQWVHEYVTHVVQGKDERVTPRQYADLLRKDGHWGQSGDLFILARRFKMNFILISGNQHALYPYAEINQPNDHTVSPFSSV
jgi:hypothetical protein